MTLDPDNPGVSYSIKELFERVDEKLTGIAHSLDSKADKSDLDALRAEVNEIKLWRARVVGIAAGVGAVVGSGAFGLLRALA